MTETKQITFEGREYTVPVWVEWVARDEGGTKCGYEKEPIERKDMFVVDTGRHFVIADVMKIDWRDSLTKV